jgi:ribosomal 50S subunit-recycling heat shock protein
MRIDLALKHLCLVKSRSIAKSLCDDDRVLVDGTPVRPSQSVAGGSRITIHFRARTVTVELLQIPRKQLSKSAAVDYYRRVETPPADGPERSAEDDRRNW